jgi:hypothetical protein
VACYTVNFMYSSGSLLLSVLLSYMNSLAYTAVREMARLGRSVNTQPAVRRFEPSMSFAFNSSFLSVAGMTCLIPFES